MWTCDGSNVRQVTDNTHNDFEPVWSPDDTEILFTSDRDGDSEIFVMKTDGTDVRQLTNNSADDVATNGAWRRTRRGSHLFGDVPVGHWADEAIGWAVTHGIITGTSDRTFDLDGNVSRADIVTLLYRTAHLLDSSRIDSTGVLQNGEIVFHAWADDNYEIFKANPDGIFQLTHTPSHEDHPAVSPDGAQIAFTRSRDGDFEIFVMDADGTNVQQLTVNTHYDALPTWSADGTTIAFVRDLGQGLQIFVMNTDGTNQHQLTKAPTNHNSPIWSPDGAKIAFAKQTPTNDEIFVMNADGTNQQQLTSGYIDSHPAWSPDGTRIAFNRETNGRKEIMVMDANGTNVRQLTQGNHNPGGLTWSANSTQILYLSDVATGIEIFVMNADGTDVRQLTENTPLPFKNVTAQSWSPTPLPMGSDIFTDIPGGHKADRPIGWQPPTGSPWE